MYSKDNKLLPYPESTINKVKLIFQLRNEGIALRAIGKQLNISHEFVRLVLNGESYKDIINRYNLKVEDVNNTRIGSFPRKKFLNLANKLMTNVSIDEVLTEFDIKESTLKKLFHPNNKKTETFLINNGFDINIIIDRLDTRSFQKSDIQKIFMMAEEGKYQSDIAKEFDTGQTHISAILRGELYKKEIEELKLEPVHTKLKENNIIKIFKLYNSGMSQSEIADKLNISIPTVGLNLNGSSKLSKEVINRYNLKKREIIHRKSRSLSENQVLEIFRLRTEENLSYAKIAAKFNLNESSIVKILKGQSYKDISTKFGLI